MAAEKESGIMLEDHEKSLGELEKTQKEFSKQMQDMKSELQGVKTGLVDVENTVMKGNISTQELQKEIKDMQTDSAEKVDKVFDILVTMVKGESKNKTDLKKARLSTVERVFVALAGGGGLAGIISVIAALTH